MALVDNAWYVGSVGYTAVTAWAAGAAKSAGNLVRQSAAPTVGNERVFVCIVGGTTHATTEPTWTVTRGAKTTDNTVTWQEATGVAAFNGDKTNTPTWTTIKNTAITLGQVIQSTNGNFILICTTAGTAGNGAEPTWSAYTTAGATTADNTATWTTVKDSGNNFANWAAPHARLGNACTTNWQQTGNNVYIASNSAETQTTAITINPPGGCQIISVDQTGAVPPTARTAGASVSIGAGNVQMQINTPGQTITYVDGVTFNGGTNASANCNIALNLNTATMVFRNCSFVIRSTSGLQLLVSNTTVSGDTILDNCNITLPSTASAKVTFRQRVLWKNGTLTLGATQPSTLFGTTAAGNAWETVVDGVDLSAYTGAALVTHSGSTGYIVFKDCKLGAYTTTLAGSLAPYGATVDLIRCDTGNTNYVTKRSVYAGEISTDTATVRTGGASDGTTSISWKFVSNSSASTVWPLEATPVRIWNDTVGSAINVTIYGAGSATPTDKEVFFEIRYLGSNSSPLGSTAYAGTEDILATGANWTTDGTSAWSGSPSNKFKLTKAITPQQKGYIYIYVKVTKASSTYYIDPKPVLS